MNSKTYTLPQALMIIRNPETYDRAIVIHAALWITGSMLASVEDRLQAASLL